MSTDAGGCFVDWDGNIRSTDDPGNGFYCEVDKPARYVAVLGKGGAVMHEATLYRDVAAVARAGIQAQWVPSSQPWGKPGV